MRAVDYFEAYLDDFDKIVIFFSKGQPSILSA